MSELRKNLPITFARHADGSVTPRTGEQTRIAAEHQSEPVDPRSKIKSQRSKELLSVPSPLDHLKAVLGINERNSS